jgi:hypothetical protein
VTIGQRVRARAPVGGQECRLYRFWGHHPRTRRVVLLYIGETGRRPMTRLLEHVYDQPWSGDITAWQVDERVFAGKDSVLAAEREAIEAEWPLYNVEHNGGNPHRVVTRGPVRRPVPFRRPAWAPVRRGRRARMPRWPVWAGLWLVLALTAGGWSVARGLTPADGAWVGVGVASVLLGTLQGRRVRRR